MAQRPPSPVSQLLATIGVSREELLRRSRDMRKFLSAGDNDFASSPDSSPAQIPVSASQPTSWLSQNSNASSSHLTRVSSSSSLLDASPSKSSHPSPSIEPKSAFTMEAVIERQRRNSRREKRSKTRKHKVLPQVHLPSSPTPSTASLHRQDLSPTRQGASMPCPKTPPMMTPQQAKYYRPHTAESRASVTVKTEPQPDTLQEPSPATDILAQALAALAQQHGSSLPPSTPAYRTINADSSPLPSSSPPAETPSSSPCRPVNLVSSPGPMLSPTKLHCGPRPYKLPGGPYSSTKPDFSYAAMIGQALLSSNEHRLTLQEIYDWITIVYPYYKRGETTWMNSIRHVLSTTITFRKVPRDRSIGRTLWAIWDEDIPCFEGGGFKKYLCKDYTDNLQAKGLQPPLSVSKAKPRVRKREEVEESIPPVAESSASGASRPPTKKSRKSEEEASSLATQLAQYGRQARTIFGPTGTSSNQQTYYDVCLATAARSSVATVVHPSSSGLLLPPLITAPSQQIPPAAISHPPQDDDGELMEDTRDILTTTPQSAMRSQLQYETSHNPPSNISTSSRLSVPILTPHRSSSSPAPSYLATSEADIDEYINVPDDEDEDGDSWDDKGGRHSPLMRQRWGHDIVPGSLLRSNEMRDHEGDTRPPQMYSVFDSPTANRRSSQKRSRASTPPPRDSGSIGMLPCTPPKFRGRSSTSNDNGGGGARKLPLSPQSTPLSHRGVYMSPSASLAHYKSNLDPPPPPPALAFGKGGERGGGGEEGAGGERQESEGRLDETETENLRTPCRRTSNSGGSLSRHQGQGHGQGSSSSSNAPAAPSSSSSSSFLTPRRLPYPTSSSSPFRTPNSHPRNMGGAAYSSIITPWRGIGGAGAGGVMDLYDPSVILDEEMRMRSRCDESPGAPFGLGRKNLLYQSPGALGTPGRFW